jgi:hypothetical protein
MLCHRDVRSELVLCGRLSDMIEPPPFRAKGERARPGSSPADSIIVRASVRRFPAEQANTALREPA